MKGDEKFPIEQSIIVPSTNKQQHRVSFKVFKNRITKVEGYLARTFGGYTSISGKGGYRSDHNKIVREPNVTVTSFGQRHEYKSHKKELIKKARDWGYHWGQESIGYGIEGDLRYLRSQDAKMKRKKRR